MSAVTMLDTIVPKSDQLNADDLIGGPRTITLTGTKVSRDEQPVALHFEGDNGKPYKPCKSMRRVLVKAWGADANEYAGRAMTLYRDDAVVFGGQPVGGIRISHMTHIDRELVIPLTVTRAQRKPFTVKPLRGSTQSRMPAREERPRQDPEEREPAGGGFGGQGPSDDDAEVSAAVAWGRNLQEDLEGDVFREAADLDAVVSNPDNIQLFLALEAEKPEFAKRLNAAITGRRKALAGRRG